LFAELTFLEVGFYLMTGSVAGLVAGLLGVGGGLFIVPVLLFLLPATGVESHQLMTICVATSLCTIVITSISSVLAHQKHQAILWPVFWRFVPGIILGALSGAAIADVVSQQLLKSLFAVSVILIAIKMLFQLQPKATSRDTRFTCTQYFRNIDRLPFCHDRNWWRRFDSASTQLLENTHGEGCGHISNLWASYCNCRYHRFYRNRP